MTAEEWRPVAGHPDYFVSDRGRVSSTKYRQSPALLRPGRGSNGYWFVTLYQNGRGQSRSVHSLVAEAFHGPCPADGFEVRHLNGQKLDCRAENLRWGSRSENSYDAVRHGTHPAAGRTHCVNGHPFDEANTYAAPSQRVCKTCRRATKARYRARRALARAS